MKIFLTGHDGYVGTLLIDMLRRSGHDVRGVDACFFDGCGLSRTSRSGNGTGSRKDVRDVLETELAGYEAVIHLAALSNDPLGSLNAEWTRAINHKASVRLATAARSAGVSRFVFASSCSLYGAAGSSNVGEDAPLNPLTPYGHSKIGVERALTELAHEDFSPTFLRAATAYGVSPRLRGDVVVNNLVGSAVTRGEVRLESDGQSWRPLLHVEDMCRAFLAVLEAPREAVHGEAFNLVPPGENYRIRDVAEMVAAEIPGSKVTIAREGGGHDPRSYRVDGSKLLSVVPAFAPEWTVAQGIRQVLRALEETRLFEEDFFGPRFIRIQHLQQLLKGGHLDEDLRWSLPATERRPRSLLEAPGLATSPPSGA